MAARESPVPPAVTLGEGTCPTLNLSALARGCRKCTGKVDHRLGMPFTWLRYPNNLEWTQSSSTGTCQETRIMVVTLDISLNTEALAKG